MPIYYKNRLGLDLIDLHIHVGGAVAPHIMWEIAHQQGMKLPVGSYWDFWELITVRPGEVKNLDEYVAIMHQWTEKIQSSPEAIERCVYSIIAKEYRSSNVSQMEIRFNPMKRNKGGELDLDNIVHAAIRGLDRASLDYSVKAGLIFCLAREFPIELNEIILRKAIKFKDWGVIGIDLAGPERHTLEQDPNFHQYQALFEEARQAGLGITVHTGETADTGPQSLIKAVQLLQPNRIGHGVQAARSEEAMQLLAETKTVLEICPTSNIETKAVASWDELKEILAKFRKAGVRYTINTDGPYLLRTNLKREIELLLDNNVLTEQEVRESIKVAYQASFIR